MKMKRNEKQSKKSTTNIRSNNMNSCSNNATSSSRDCKNNESHNMDCK